ncbi:unnamed protein product [Cuscuta campestris]|uniref:Uncharacterized protein n=1 Tax=Cuscuta campestris TaxID=132261 RepID=A0A484LJX9_9ASTE|nr:unnamed protein product [Cuscuta campestris]
MVQTSYWFSTYLFRSCQTAPYILSKKKDEKSHDQNSEHHLVSIGGYCDLGFDMEGFLRPSAKVLGTKLPQLLSHIIDLFVAFLRQHLMHCRRIFPHAFSTLPLNHRFDHHHYFTAVVLSTAVPDNFHCHPYLSASLAFTGWSICMGMAMIGTPYFMPSMTELLPQWLTNPLMLGCSKIFACGATPVTTKPLSPTLSKNPSGKTCLRASWFASLGNLKTQTKLRLLR